MICSLLPLTRDISISDPHDNSFSYAMCTHTTTVTVIPLVIQSGEVDRAVMGYEEVRQTINKLYGNTIYQN